MIAPKTLKGKIKLALSAKQSFFGLDAKEIFCDEFTMTDLDRRGHDLFIEAIELPQSQWPSFLETNCESSDLRKRVQELLDAHKRHGDFLTETAMEAYPNLAFPFCGQIEEFRIIRLIGKGGMGHVYLAEDTVLKRLVALKIVGHSDSQSSTNEEVVDRFRREARAAARLDHPSVVQVYRSGEKDGLSYIAMEYVNGTTLQEKLELEGVSTEIDTAQRFREVAKLISQVADAMDHAHRADVIHRDIKPSNILIDADGNARLADFGVARITTEDTLLRPGTIVGSCAYMSPEQARVSEVEVDHRTDVFSLGVVLYEAICLQRPFEGATFNDVLKALSDCNPKPLKKIVRKIPHDLSVVCHKAIEKDVIDRYQSASHFFADLRCFAEGKPILARPPSYGRRMRNWAEKHQRFVAVGVIGLLATAVIGLLFAYQSSQHAQMGKLEVSGQHRGAFVTVELFSADLRIEKTMEIGTAPISTYLSPGLYRVTIQDAKSKLEATSLIDAGAVDFVEVNPPSNELVASLVMIPGGLYVLGSPTSTFPLSSQRKRVMPTFRISSTEVSNREYREYVLAMKVEMPTTWSTPYDKEIDDLPVTGITWDAANLYCRWRGVRLPTPDEWEAASQGTDGATFPWGNERHKDIRREETPNFNLSAYRKFARPVGSQPHLATPFGIKHMLSNVQEYTEGIAIDRNRGLIVKGRSWANSPFFAPSDMFTLSSRDASSLDRGFRIAISINDER